MFKVILPGVFMLFSSHISPVSWGVCVSALIAVSGGSLTYIFQPFVSVFSPTGFFTISFLGGPLIILTVWVSSLMVAASFKTLLSHKVSGFVAMVVSLCVVLVVTFSVNNIFSFYIFFETALIPTLVLILGWGYQPERLQASMYLMMYTICASLPLLFSVLYYYYSVQHLSFLFFFHFFFSGSFSRVWWVCFIFAFLVKMPMYLTHLWLPKAHVEAPVAGSMILAGVLLKLGGYGILQVMSFFPSPCVFTSSFFVCVSMCGAVFTALICLRQSDMKSLVAYSSVGHMGLVISGAMSNTNWGWFGCLIMMVAHGVCSPALFALANMTYEGAKTRSVYLCKGLLMLFPSFSFWWFIFCAANMAAPPSVNLLGEITLFVGIVSQSQSMVILLAFSSFLAGAYSLLLYTATQHGANPSFFNPFHLLSPRNYTTLVLHAAPLLILVAKADLLFTV